MPDLYPLRLQPQFHERVWGSLSLAPVYSHAVSGKPVGEVWLTGEGCEIGNGPLAGRTLAAVSREFREQLLGTGNGASERFPLLIKFLFPQEKLSVQVHPDDEAALQMNQACGKTECWYILHAEPGAQIGLGLKPGTTKLQVEQAIRETRMEQLLNWIDVRPGEMFYVDAGTVHAIGAGSVIVETQQNSDTTYRLYDYGRPRELHVEAGLRVTKERTHAGKVAPENAQAEQGKAQVNLVTCPNFVVDKFHLTSPWQFQRPRHARRSVWCLVAIAGCGVLESEGAAPITFTAGEVVIVPAAVDGFILNPQWEVQFLCSSLPVDPVGQPRTVPAGDGVGRAY
jgi:mannose-6-phosphate isomerase